jgi:carbonic anhydrase/acetyltransferase-like protein (isoleucine patch superfamily)
MIFKFKKYIPVIHESSFIHPLASVTGNVIIGKNVFVGSGAAVRGDFGEIIIEDGCNIQENCIIHMFPGVTVRLKKGAHIGHGAIVHGASVGENVLIGMNAVIMDDVEIGNDSIIGAMTLVTEGMKIPERKLVVGNPAKIIKDVTGDMLEWKTEGTRVYRQLTGDCLAHLRETQPVRTHSSKKEKQKAGYKTWKKTKK